MAGKDILKLLGRGVSKGLEKVGSVAEGVEKGVLKSGMAKKVLGKAGVKTGGLAKTVDKAYLGISETLLDAAKKLKLPTLLKKMGYSNKQIADYLKSPKVKKALLGAVRAGQAGSVVGAGAGAYAVGKLIDSKTGEEIKY